MATIRISQAGDEPKLKVNVKESGKTVSVKGRAFTVGVESNIDWVAGPGRSGRCLVGYDRRRHACEPNFHLCGRSGLQAA